MKKRTFEESSFEQISSGQQLRYTLLVRQQPRQARLCSFRDKVDRRPIDPPPIVQLVAEGDPNENYLQNPYFFLYVNVVQPDSFREINYFGGNRVCVGTVVQSLYKLKDLDNSDGGFFVYPDISVRLEGTFRLKFTLYEIKRQAAIYRTSVYSDVFVVYAPKLFPGMQESTFLTRMFSDQGVRMRIRKENRAQAMRRRSEEAAAKEMEDDIMAPSNPEYPEPKTHFPAAPLVTQLLQKRHGLGEPPKLMLDPTPPHTPSPLTTSFSVSMAYTPSSPRVASQRAALPPLPPPPSSATRFSHDARKDSSNHEFTRLFSNYASQFSCLQPPLSPPPLSASHPHFPPAISTSVASDRPARIPTQMLR
ncbi:uncharacterized protein VTP21DRAFT_2400 [Calcarisporiella thermophila]|uniref:uncharacterized protein n=1 Tax=Calcarisporiella thermophila TaxID=911321 RepID=UPI003743313D